MRQGHTLVEILVVIVLLAIMAGTASLAFSSPRRAARAVAPGATCRRAAVRDGAPAYGHLERVPVLCLPDGQVVGARGRQFDGAMER
ncbi:MAG: type II secretion system protein [Chloroflexi bacterium]|nr:type II secretion system protein [Chloroflexota bacterium]